MNQLVQTRLQAMTAGGHCRASFQLIHAEKPFPLGPEHTLLLVGLAASEAGAPGSLPTLAASTSTAALIPGAPACIRPWSMSSAETGIGSCGSSPGILTSVCHAGCAACHISRRHNSARKSAPLLQLP